MYVLLRYIRVFLFFYVTINNIFFQLKTYYTRGSVGYGFLDFFCYRNNVISLVFNKNYKTTQTVNK